MINANRVYLVHPIYGKPEMFTSQSAAEHYRHLCNLMSLEASITSYQCDTLNFKDFAEMHKYYCVAYKPSDNIFILEPDDYESQDSLHGDEGGCICVPSSHQAVQDLFLKGDEQPLKNLVLDKCKGAVNETDIS